MLNLFTLGFVEQQPELAIVLRTTMPSGAPKILRLRDKLLNLLGPLLVQFVRAGLAVCRHDREVAAAWPADIVYTGGGRLDVQRRPSPDSNPFLQLSRKCHLRELSELRMWLTLLGLRQPLLLRCPYCPTLRAQWRLIAQC